MVNKKCCLSFNRDLKYYWTTSWNPAKTARAGKNNRSLEKRPYPILSGFVLSRKRWSRIIPKEWKLLAASSESMQRVTTVVSGRSVKCNAIFAVWIFAVVDLFSRVDTSHFQYLGTPCNVRTTNTHNIVLYAKIWLPGRIKFWILRLF